MLSLRRRRWHSTAENEDGAVLVITVASMFVILVIAAFAIDTAIWWVHGRHLQTQADAAALAAAQGFQFPCTATSDSQIAQVVNQYDGTTAAPPGTGYNPQLPVTPVAATTYSRTQHNLFSLLNSPTFEHQSVPNPPDTVGSPPVALTPNHPCEDSAIDVKMTETNLPSFFPFISPPYINRQARVSIENLTSTSTGLEPLAEPLPTPNAITANLIDEGNGNNVIGTVNLNSNAARSTWTGAIPTSVTLGTNGPIGLQIATSNGSPPVTCTAGTCFDATDNIGVTYTRVWSSGSPNYPTTPPEVDDATVAPAATGACPGASGSAFSNFISTGSSCSVTLAATLRFGAGAQCSTAGTFAVSYGTSTATMSNPACSSGTASPSGTWTSSAIAIGSAANAIPLTLQWSRTTGTLPTWPGATGGNQGTCTNGKPCTFSFGVIQRVFSGAFDEQSANGSNSGPILAAAVTDSSGHEIQSVQKGTSYPANSITISLSVVSFQNSQSITPLSAPIELSFGGNQANALVTCPNTSPGGPQTRDAIWLGCQPPDNNFALDGNFSSTPCNPTTNTAGAYLCLPTNSGNGKLDKYLDDAMQCKINGSSSTTDCNPVAGCVHPNYWASGSHNNTIQELLDESPADPRLLTLFTTDNGALGNGRTQVPIRIITHFYVTGWQGDPCIGKANGFNTVGQVTGGTVSLDYTTDVSPSATTQDPSGVLLGHFVENTQLGDGTGSGQCGQSSSLSSCISILTK
jgi:Flp pilus assembly protein TadG